MVLQSVVYNEWQGVTYMMLDMLEDHNIQYMEAVKAAFKTNKFNLALSLVRKQRDAAKLCTVDTENRNLNHWLALSKCSAAGPELQKRVGTRWLHSTMVLVKGNPTLCDYSLFI